jgi:multidrug transporter EmrE-like cation transporter
MMVLVNDKYNIIGTLLMNFEKHNLLKIILIILFIGLIIGVSILISKVKPTNVLLSYGLWLLLIISFGIVLLLNNLSAKLSNNLTLIFI